MKMLLAVAVALIAAHGAAATTAHAQQTIKIGTATDLTGLGVLIAKAGVTGMEIAVEDINAMKG